MTTSLKPHQQAIQANLEVLAAMLKEASAVVEEGIPYAQQGEQNILIGGLLKLENSLEACKGLYDAILALHRAYPQR